MCEFQSVPSLLLLGGTRTQLFFLLTILIECFPGCSLRQQVVGQAESWLGDSFQSVYTIYLKLSLNTNPFGDLTVRATPLHQPNVIYLI